MYKYEMHPTKTVGATERTQNAGRMDRWTDKTDGVCPIYPPNNLKNMGKQSGPLLLTWFNLNPSMISDHMPNKALDAITYPVEVYEWISNFIQHFTMYVITYQCGD